AAQLLARLARARGVGVGDGDARTPPRQRPGDRAADEARAARHDRRPAVEGCRRHSPTSRSRAPRPVDVPDASRAPAGPGGRTLPYAERRGILGRWRPPRSPPVAGPSGPGPRRPRARGEALAARLLHALLRAHLPRLPRLVRLARLHARRRGLRRWLGLEHAQRVSTGDLDGM